MLLSEVCDLDLELLELLGVGVLQLLQFSFDFLSWLLLSPDFFLQVNDDLFVGFGQRLLLLFETSVFRLQFGDCALVLGHAHRQPRDRILQLLFTLRRWWCGMLQFGEFCFQPVSLFIDKPNLLHLHFQFIPQLPHHRTLLLPALLLTKFRLQLLNLGCVCPALVNGLLDLLGQLDALLSFLLFALF